MMSSGFLASKRAWRTLNWVGCGSIRSILLYALQYLSLKAQFGCEVGFFEAIRGQKDCLEVQAQKVRSNTSKEQTFSPCSHLFAALRNSLTLDTLMNSAITSTWMTDNEGVNPLSTNQREEQESKNWQTDYKSSTLTWPEK